MMPLREGDVVRLFDNTTNPPKSKLFLCVDAGEGWFLRINTKPIWPPHFPLPRAGNEHCLDHDSFLELRGVIEYYEIEIDEALRYPNNHLGPLSDATIRAIIAHLPGVKTLTADEQKRIIDNLSATV